MIAAPINEDDYFLAGGVAEFVPVGEFGPLACGCCIVATEVDPVGPRLVFIMQRTDSAPHTHHTLDDFADVMPA